MLRNASFEKSTWLIYWNRRSSNRHFHGLGKTAARTTCKEKSTTDLVLSQQYWP